jgi:predicted transcriptional regulator of viral defense system
MRVGATHSEETGWDALYAVAEAQSGHFSAQQATDIGFYPQRLRKYLLSKRIQRVRRGIYRLTHFPLGEHEELVIYWLWSAQQGVYSGETALSLHELSDVLPTKLELTLPASWQKRRLRVPDGLVLHFADIQDRERAWMGSVPITNPKRTIEDCIVADVQPDLVDQAIEQAKDRGLITKAVAMALFKKAEARR